MLMFLVPEDFRKFRMFPLIGSSHHTHGAQRRVAEIGSQTGLLNKTRGAICVLPNVELGGRTGTLDVCPRALDVCPLALT